MSEFVIVADDLSGAADCAVVTKARAFGDSSTLLRSRVALKTLIEGKRPSAASISQPTGTAT
jgi:hypothetical protein